MGCKIFWGLNKNIKLISQYHINYKSGPIQTKHLLSIHFKVLILA